MKDGAANDRNTIEIALLDALLREVETRLGTNRERDGDLERAQELAHQLDNLHTVAKLTNGV